MEFVYVVRRRDLFERECPQGYLPPGSFLEPISRLGFFVERRHAEGDASLKQIIPYCLVGDGREGLCLRRLPKQGEKRLHDKLSIGIGGHLNPEDAGRSILERGALREIREEIGLESPPTAIVGVINDDSTPVGSVHFGVVFAVAGPRDLAIRETDAMTGRFEPWSALRQRALEGANFESWSALILRTWTAPDFDAAFAPLRSQLRPEPRTASFPTAL